MAEHIINLPTAAQKPIGKQDHRGRYPKGVYPAWKLDVRRRARAEQVEREQSKIAAEKQARYEMGYFLGKLSGRSSNDAVGAIVILKKKDGSEAVYVHGSFEQNEALYASLQRTLLRLFTSEQEEE